MEEVEFCKNCRSLFLIDYKGMPFCNNCGAINYSDYTTIENWLDENNKEL